MCACRMAPFCQRAGSTWSCRPRSEFTFSRRYDWDHPTLGRRVTRVTYRFDAIEGGTRVTVRQDEFGSPDAAREHAIGWERTLNLLHA